MPTKDFLRKMKNMKYKACKKWLELILPPLIAIYAIKKAIDQHTKTIEKAMAYIIVEALIFLVMPLSIAYLTYTALIEKHTTLEGVGLVIIILISIVVEIGTITLFCLIRVTETESNVENTGVENE